MIQLPSRRYPSSLGSPVPAERVGFSASPRIVTASFTRGCSTARFCRLHRIDLTHALALWPPVVPAGADSVLLRRQSFDIGFRSCRLSAAPARGQSDSNTPLSPRFFACRARMLAPLGGPARCEPLSEHPATRGSVPAASPVSSTDGCNSRFCFQRQVTRCLGALRGASHAHA